MDADAENRVREALPQLYKMLFHLHELRNKPVHDREDVAQETILNVLRQKSLFRECHQMLKGSQFTAVPFRVKELMFRLWKRHVKKAMPTIGVDLPESSIRKPRGGPLTWLDSLEYSEGTIDEQLIDLLKRGYSKEELCSRMGLSTRFLAKWLEQKRSQLRVYSRSTH